MSKLEAIAKAFEQIENEELIKVGEELKKIDNNMAKRTDALGVLLDNTNDAIDDVLTGVKKLLEYEMNDDDTKEKEKEKRHNAMLADIKKTVQAIPAMIEKPVDVSYDIKNSLFRISELEVEVKNMSSMMEMLLTAKRVPKFDKNGNVIAVTLEE
jgi:hypothetical protein